MNIDKSKILNPEKLPLMNRFLKFVQPPDKNNCFNWSGAKSNGYGIMSSHFGKSPYKSHRVSYELFNGEIPLGFVVRHKCDNPSCVNPEHLEIGTQKENIKDASKRNRLNPKSRMNLRPGALGFYGAGPKSNMELHNGII